jgi:S1-C subfamily serine protease
MPEIVQDALSELSEALVERARGAQSLVACITGHGRSMRSRTLWRKDVVVASEQSLLDIDQAEVTLSDGVSSTARLAGRDPGTNVVVFRLEGTLEPSPLLAPEPRLGALALAFGADSSGLSMRLGTINSVGPAWHSRAGGRIDRRIALDMRLADREEGGPVLDAAGGGLLGSSSAGSNTGGIASRSRPATWADDHEGGEWWSGGEGWDPCGGYPRHSRRQGCQSAIDGDRTSWYGIDRPIG